MVKGDKVQSKNKFKLMNAVVDLVLGGRVQVRHDIWKKKWIGQRPQLGDVSRKKETIFCRFTDLFDCNDLVVISE